MLIKASILTMAKMYFISALFILGHLAAAKCQTNSTTDPQEVVKLLKNDGLILVVVPDSEQKHALLRSAIEKSTGKKAKSLQKELDQSMAWRDSMYFTIYDAFRDHFSFSDYAIVLDSEIRPDDLSSGTIDELIDKEYKTQKVTLPNFYIRIFPGTSSSGQQFDSDWYAALPGDDNQSEFGKRRVRDTRMIYDSPNNIIRAIARLLRKPINLMREEHKAAVLSINRAMTEMYERNSGKLFKAR